MTTFLAAGTSLLARALFLAFALLVLLVLAIVVGAQAAFAQEVVSAQPLPQPVSAVPTITLWRDGAIMVALVIGVAVIVWRASMFDAWVRGRIEMHGLAAALIEDELVKRGVVTRAPATPPEPTLDDDPWAAEADRVAPPPPPPPPAPPKPAPKPVVVNGPTVADMAHKFAPRRRKGSVMQ